MFIITNNQEIRISKGDDSGKFPLLLNQGTKISPNFYEFSEPIYLGGLTSLNFEVTFDRAKFRSKVFSGGLYSFYYLYEKWYLFDEEVILADYGINCVGLLENEDAFSIIYNTDNDDQVRFYIVEVNLPIENWIVRKTFYKSGYVISEYLNRIPKKETNTTMIDGDGNMNIWLTSSDTDWLEPGEYNYIVLASLVDKVTKKSNVSTVTNRLPFYVIDDNFNRRWE